MNRSTPFFLAALGLALLIALAWTTPSPAHAATPTPEPVEGPTTITQTVTATRNANLRAGPGTTHKVIGSVKTGQQLTVVGKTPAGDWLQLDTQAWIAAFLVKPAPAPEPVEGPPTATPAPGAAPTKAAKAPPPTATPAPAPVAGPPNVSLLILVNSGQQEILAIRNDGSAPLNISAWWLNGSKGDETCTIPNGITLAPGASYQIATGDSASTGPGYSCGNKVIWNNDGETIYLHMSDGQTLSIESVRV